MIIFSGNPGRVAVLQDPAVVANISMVSLVGGSQATNALLSTSVLINAYSVAPKANYNFMHAFGGDIFTYVFGDRMGDAAVRGLAFASDCSIWSVNGVDAMYQFWEENRISNRATPLALTIGNRTTLLAYLVQMSIGSNDPQTRISQFELQLALVPPENR